MDTQVDTQVRSARPGRQVRSPDQTRGAPHDLEGRASGRTRNRERLIARNGDRPYASKPKVRGRRVAPRGVNMGFAITHERRSRPPFAGGGGAAARRRGAAGWLGRAGGLVAVVVLIVTGGCAGNRMSVSSSAQGQAAPETGSFTDPRDGRTYRTVRIGGRWLMAENLAYRPESGNFWAYDDNQENVKTYGYLYDWETAKGVAPPGWHLPTYQEWRELRAALGGKRDVFKYLGGTMEKVYKQVVPGGGSGFDALLGGRRTPSGRFIQMGEFAYFWTATIYSKSEGVRCFVVDSKAGGVRQGPFDSREGVAHFSNYADPAAGLSVRLFRD